MSKSYIFIKSQFGQMSQICDNGPLRVIKQAETIIIHILKYNA